MKRKMIYVCSLVGLVGILSVAWTMTARGAYESAEYKVVTKDGLIEIREYPELVLAATDSNMDAQGRDGSFMRLFQYISGANKSEKKIAMTTPVFMEGEVGSRGVSMGFVMPKAVATEGVPEPSGKGVEIRKRAGGRFAVIRFSGKLDSKTAKAQEEKLRSWMNDRGLMGEESSEAAGYDPPFTPGFLRRNEILIRLKVEADAS